VDPDREAETGMIEKRDRPTTEVETEIGTETEIEVEIEKELGERKPEKVENGRERESVFQSQQKNNSKRSEGSKNNRPLTKNRKKRSFVGNTCWTKSPG
jgi:hypothetical protein